MKQKTISVRPETFEELEKRKESTETWDAFMRRTLIGDDAKRAWTESEIRSIVEAEIESYAGIGGRP